MSLEATAGEARVLCLRGSMTESTHLVHAVVADGEGKVMAALGDPSRLTYYRSAAKLFQALPLVEDGVMEALGMDDGDLALCCGSHGGETEHVRRAREILVKAGFTEEDLECGAHRPMWDEAAGALFRSGGSPRPVHNNCSGKHAGMLALARHHGWPSRRYIDASHPVQRRMRREVARWSGLDAEEIVGGTDGCGVVCFAVPLRRMAASFARFGAAARNGEGPARILRALAAHPFLMAGTGRLCTALLEETGGRLFAKVGAEGVYGAGVPRRGLGIAVKVEDGGGRAAGVALLQILKELELLDPSELEELASFRRPRIRNTLGREVGELRADFRLEPGR